MLPNIFLNIYFTTNLTWSTLIDFFPILCLTSIYNNLFVYLDCNNRERLTERTAQKMKFSIKDFFSKCDQLHSLVTFTEEIINRKLHFLCSDGYMEIMTFWGTFPKRLIHFIPSKNFRKPYVFVYVFWASRKRQEAWNGWNENWPEMPHSAK